MKPVPVGTEDQSDFLKSIILSASRSVRRSRTEEGIGVIISGQRIHMVAETVSRAKKILTLRRRHIGV